MAEKGTPMPVAVAEPTGQQLKRPESPMHLPSWEKRFKELKRFKGRHGHCNVPVRYRRNPALGYWVANVRNAKKQGTLAEERIRRLDVLAFCWTLNPDIADVRKHHIDELKAFKKEHGHCDVPSKYQPNPALGSWVAGLRQRNKRGKLDKKTIHCLNTLGFRWVWRVTLEQRIHDLKAFKKKHGHCDVPMRYPLNASLGRWVNAVRQRKKSSYSRGLTAMVSSVLSA